jgi:hypothetical protein
MTEDLTCEELRELEAELALGILPARDRARAIVHLDHCPGCRAEVEQLTRIGDGLLGLLPGSEPPAGFETRVLDRLRLSPPRRSPVTRLRLAVAAVALAVASLFGGWTIGVRTAQQGTDPTLVSAPLMAPGHQQVGTVHAHPGSDGWLYMSVDLDNATTARVTCHLSRPDGSRITVGSFTLKNGYGYWAAPAPLDGDSATTATLTTTTGTLLASARLSGD